MTSEYLENLKKKKTHYQSKIDLLNELISEEENKLRINAFQKKEVHENSFPILDELTKSSHSFVKTRRLNIGNTDAEKFLWVLKENKRFMKVNEIAEYLSKVTDEDFEYWKTKMTRKTKSLREADKIVKFQVGNSRINVFWGSPNWLDREGDIKSEYMYNEEAISSTGSSIDDFEL